MIKNTVKIITDKAAVMILAGALALTAIPMFSVSVYADEAPNAATKEMVGGNISFPDATGWAVQWLAKNGVISGYPDGTFKPNNAVTRAEFTKMLCVALGLENEANSKSKTAAFSDLSGHAWANGYIAVLSDRGIVNGIGNGKFNPGGQVKYQEINKMLTLAMGYSESDANSRGGWPSGYASLADDTGLYETLSVGSQISNATRGNTARMMYNSAILPPPAYAPFDDGNNKGQSGFVFGVSPGAIPNTCKVYYTTDGSTPTKSSAYIDGSAANTKTEHWNVRTSGTYSFLTVNKGGKESPVAVYRYNIPKADAFQSDLANILAEIIKPGMSEAEKAKAIFDWVKSNGQDYTGKIAKLYGGGPINCVGYSHTLAVLMEKTGIETDIASGISPGGVLHQWTTAKIDGLWYHFDAAYGQHFGKTIDNMVKLGYTNDDKNGLEEERAKHSPWAASDLVAPATSAGPKTEEEDKTDETATHGSAANVLESQGYAKVPNVLNMPKDEAIAKLEAAGFTARVAEATGPYSVPQGYTHGGLMVMGESKTGADGEEYAKPGTEIQIYVQKAAGTSGTPSTTQTTPATPETSVTDTNTGEIGGPFSTPEAMGYTALPNAGGNAEATVTAVQNLGFTTRTFDVVTDDESLRDTVQKLEAMNGSIQKSGTMYATPGGDVWIWIYRSITHRLQKRGLEPGPD
jgi:hypothetical protein